MKSKFTLSDLTKLFSLAKNRKLTQEDYCKFQYFQGELLLRYLNDLNVIINGAKVLDLACGLGGYTMALENAGGKVIGLDLNPPPSTNKINFVNGDAIHSPFKPGSFDLVICASLMEHVPNPRKLLEELLRLVSSNGKIYLSFPPFYSINGGHQFAPFHYLGEKNAVKLSRKREQLSHKKWYMDVFPQSLTSYHTAYGNWGLYPLTIKSVKELLGDFPVQILDRSTRWIPIDFSGIPILGELITWHVQFLIKKL